MSSDGVSRRQLLTGLAGLALPITVTGKEDPTMYGLIGKMIAVDGKREELAKILLEGIVGMPGCLSYVVALDSEQADALWITEVWESPELHQASLQLESVKTAIAAGRPLIAGFGERFETQPLGGQGIT